MGEGGAGGEQAGGEGRVVTAAAGVARTCVAVGALCQRQGGVRRLCQRSRHTAPLFEFSGAKTYTLLINHPNLFLPAPPTLCANVALSPPVTPSPPPSPPPSLLFPPASYYVTSRPRSTGRCAGRPASTCARSPDLPCSGGCPSWDRLQFLLVGGAISGGGSGSVDGVCGSGCGSSGGGDDGGGDSGGGDDDGVVWPAVPTVRLLDTPAVATAPVSGAADRRRDEAKGLPAGGGHRSGRGGAVGRARPRVLERGPLARVGGGSAG